MQKARKLPYRYKLLTGFTMTELLVVMAVVGVLSGILITVVKPSTQINRANDAKRKADIAAIQSALELYRADNSMYPDASVMGCGLQLANANGTTIYLQKIPCDPNGKGGSFNYFYDKGTNGNYCLRACLEDSNDRQLDSVVYGDTSALSCGAIGACNPVSMNYTVVPQ